MPDIQYVAISDMHLGAHTSVLTNLKTASDEIDGLTPSPVLVKLVDCLRSLIDQNENKAVKPTLVLNGDILELALADDHDAAMAFERFIDLIMPDDNKLFDKIFFIPGNHDHHLWETARESQYVDYISSKEPVKKPWGSVLESPWHTTRMFSDPVRSFFLTALIQRRHNLADMTIQTFYPNFGLLSKDRKRCVAFHHGHFVESIYRLMSTLKTMLFTGSRIPSEVWNLEAENFAWIDFFWSALGRSSAVGQGVGQIYEKTQDPVQFKKLLANLAHGLAERFGPSITDPIEAKFLSWTFDFIYDRVFSLERNIAQDKLSDDAKQGLYGYMDGLRDQEDSQGNRIGPLTHQMSDEKVTAQDLDRLTFVFGHTHKPFQENYNFRSFPGWAKVYNSGGWVVDTVTRQELYGGAVILIDENLEATSLRMYNEAKNLEGYAVRVQEAAFPGDPPGDFHRRIVDLFNQNPALWEDFSQTVARAVNVRAQNLQTRIYSPV
jgi:UDP-2,3-diacylglucosamine pyrophosphatase LpxH